MILINILGKHINPITHVIFNQRYLTGEWGVFRAQRIENEFESPLKKKDFFYFLSVNTGPYTYLGKVKKSRGGDIVIKGPGS